MKSSVALQCVTAPDRFAVCTWQFEDGWVLPDRSC